LDQTTISLFCFCFNLLAHPYCSSKTESKGLIGPPPPNEVGNRSDGHILWHFFDDWPRSVDESDNMNAGSSMNSLTCLSVSMPGNSPASDVSLKLSTGNNIAEEEPEPVPAPIPRGNTSNWAAAGWGTKITNQVVTSMGGPLAEALRSSTTKLISHECSAPVMSPHCFWNLIYFRLVCGVVTHACIDTHTHTHTHTHQYVH